MGLPKGLTDKWEWLMGLLLPADQGGLIDWMPIPIITQLLKHPNLQCSQLGVLTILVCIPKLPYKVIRDLCLRKCYFFKSCLDNLYIASL